VHRSIAHYLEGQVNPRESTPAMIMGSAIHQAILEPDDFPLKFTVLSDGDGRSAAIKAEKARAEAGGLICLTYDQGQAIEGIQAAFKAHATAPSIVEEGQPEVSIFWEDPDTGLLLKCRPDWLRSDGDVMDLKTTTDARWRSFEKTIYDFRYHVQAAMIEDGLRANGLPFENFLLVALEKEAPFCLSVYRLTQEAIALGRKAYKSDLGKLAGYLREGGWPGYPYEVIPIGLPAWAAKYEEAICE
jgi:exodeoxyribonuclease VIII